MYGINMNNNIVYHSASLKYFKPHEHHVTRTFNEDVLLMVFDGVLRFEEDGNLYELTKGQWHIQKHNSYQSGILESDTPKYLYVHFIGDWTSSDSVLPIDGEFPVLEFMPLMIKLDELRYNNGTEIEINSVFYTIISKLFNLCTQKPNSIASKALELLTKTPSNPPTLDELSKTLNYSKNHIIRMVKKEYGCTPYSYLIDYRLNYSLKLLESTSLSISEISEKCGFSHYSAFFKYFKNKYGISPKIYRNNLL